MGRCGGGGSSVTSQSKFLSTSSHVCRGRLYYRLLDPSKEAPRSQRKEGVKLEPGVGWGWGMGAEPGLGSGKVASMVAPAASPPLLPEVLPAVGPGPLARRWRKVLPTAPPCSSPPSPTDPAEQVIVLQVFNHLSDQRPRLIARKTFLGFPGSKSTRFLSSSPIAGGGNGEREC